MRAYQQRLYGLAYRLLRDPQAAVDAAQEAFISAYLNLRTLRGNSFKAWLMHIVVNTSYDQLRARQRQRSSSLEALAGELDEGRPGLAHVPQDSPEELIERQELKEIILQALAILPFEQRAAVVLVDVEEYSYEQTAEMTRTNTGTVKSRLARGRASLRAFLLAQQELLPAKYRWGRAGGTTSNQPRGR